MKFNLNPQFIPQYSKEQNIKIEYLKDLWKNLIDNFLDKSFGLNLYNPHILVEDIITEIEENSFKNPDNKKYFYDKLNEYFNSDIIIKNYYQADFKFLRANFNTAKTKLVLEISKNIQRKFKDGGYFKNNIILLSKIIANENLLDDDIADKIHFYSQNIIIEFLKKGYILDDIKNFITNIFDGYHIQTSDEANTIITNFPHEINYRYYENDGVLDRFKLNNKIIKTLESLTLEDRIHKLSHYYFKTTVEAFYIFVIEGLKGTIDLNFNDVIFYSVEKKRFAADDQFDDENLQGEKKEKFIQVCVKVNYISNKSSLIYAISKVENIINLLNCYYETKVKMEVSSSKYIIIQNGKIITRSWSRDNNDSFKRFHDSLNINRYEKGLKEISELSFLHINSKNPQLATKLSTAIRWYSKAQNTNTQEDKLLNYWIALETLFSSDYEELKDQFENKGINKIKLIQIIVGSKQIFNYIYDYGWELYYYYSNKIRNQRANRQKMTFPDTLIKQANLIVEDGESIYLKNFIDSLHEIKKYENNFFIISKLNDLINFYGNNTYTVQSIHAYCKDVENDILRIYRFRNLIVHNAHFDNSLLPYYVWKVKEYCGNLIRNLINKLNENFEVGMTTHLLNFYMEKEKFIIELENNQADLFANVESL